MRARQLEIISANRYTTLFRQLSAAGMRLDEGDEYQVPREKPRALHKMVELLYGENVDLTRLADDARLDPWVVRQILATHASKAELQQKHSLPGTVLPFRSPTPRNDDAIEA